MATNLFGKSRLVPRAIRPLPARGRGIAFGFLESFPALGFAPACMPKRGPRNRIVNKAESNWERLLCVHHWPRPEAPAASGGFSICDSPALEGEGRLTLSAVKCETGWGDPSNRAPLETK